MDPRKMGGNVAVDTNYDIQPPDPKNPDKAFRREWGPNVIVGGKTMIRAGRVVATKTRPRRARTLR